MRMVSLWQFIASTEFVDNMDSTDMTDSTLPALPTLANDKKLNTHRADMIAATLHTE